MSRASVAGTTYVYAGPSLDAEAVHSLLPDAVVHPPIRHGDLTASPAGAGDRVVVLDGQFFQSASVRHKEICEVIARGAAVYGAASMGALRAAELGPYGMTGSGIVYRLYASGLIERDDEVALMHTEPDAGSRALTVALVSVRVALRRMVRRRVISPDDETRLLAAAEELPFTARTWRAVLHQVEGVSRTTADAIRDLVKGPAETWDIKTQDARSLLARLARKPVAPTPSLAVRVPTTVHVENWRRTADAASRTLLTAAQIYADDYPELHHRTVLQLLTGKHEDDLDRLERYGIDLAQQRGLLSAAGLARWLGAEEAAAAHDQHAIARTLVRSYRWSCGLTPLPALADAVRATPGVAQLRELITDAEQLNARLEARGYPLQRVSRAALHRHCLRRWNTTALVPALYDRGFTGLEDLDSRAVPFAAHLGLADPPRLRLLDR
ncbi:MULTISPECIES: TfuA-like protein [Streptomyces]|uniref:TfuA-like protein n=1 Tax=Streptomyces fimbriatus TaxID=68197 RepID=A0ABW0DCV8_STRFI